MLMIIVKDKSKNNLLKIKYKGKKLFLKFEWEILDDLVSSKQR